MKLKSLFENRQWISSCINKSIPENKLKFSIPSVEICNKVANDTTPIPSLNNDSPTIFISIDLERFTFFKIPATEIGSVGEINDPKSKQVIYGALILKTGNK